MTEHELIVAPADTVALPPTPEPVAANGSAPVETPASEQTVQAPPTDHVPAANGLNGDGAATSRWHAEAGRKGARRLQQLIQEGKLYEQEHGLKRGRQRRHQLIELGKLYEQEHGIRPEREKKAARRLSRLGRDELLATFLRCLVRIARPSFRPELARLIEVLHGEGETPPEQASPVG
jgi:hypothetical protein